MEDLMQMHEMTEADIRSQFIDPALRRAGWDDHAQVRREHDFTDGYCRGEECKPLQGELMNKITRRKFCAEVSATVAVPAAEILADIEKSSEILVNRCFEHELTAEHCANSQSLAILGDSLEILKAMKQKSVDLIFADPPYNIGKNFGNNQDHWSDAYAYVEWCKSWIDECMRVLKDNGTFYFMTATQHMPYIDVFVSEKYHVLSRIVWAYDSSGVQSKKMFGSLYEPILMISKSTGSQVVFNAQDIMVEAKTGAKRKLIDYRKDPPQPYNTQKVPGNVWNFSRVRFKMDEYENHPTQKPEALLDRIIKASSNPGDIVLDPFAGSFTTSAVAVRNGRHAIGIDINREYFEIGIRRTGISAEYKGRMLVKEKIRKTDAKSKHVR